ncbi:MAG TPA: YkvA family protein [Gemmatimonadaceae bacterium]
MTIRAERFPDRDAPRQRHGARHGARHSHSPRRRAKRTLLDVIRQIPSYLRLLRGLLTDGRVSRLDKALVVGAILYIITPIDLLPDFIPFLGQVDDVYILVLALQRLISHAGVDVLEAHWRGDPRDLTPSALRSTLMAATMFLPGGIRRRLRRRVR